MMSLVIFITLLHLFLLPVYSANCQITNCAQCIDNSVCSQCNDGYHLYSGTCLQCPSQCSQCYHSKNCLSCVTSYWNPGGLCNVPCSTNCSSSGCDDDNGDCYECVPGRYGSRCDRNCDLCHNSECDQRQCTNGCKYGYVQYNTGSGYSDCYSCPSNCIKCSNATYCTQCELGFYGYYYRLIINGRGRRQCNPCQKECIQCTSIGQCPECNTECIKQGCDASGSCVTTRVTTSSTLHTDSTNSALSTAEVTHTTTNHTACPKECAEDCDVRCKCHDSTTRDSKSDGSSFISPEKSYYEGVGHGMAAGIGIVLVVGTLVGIGIFLTRRTNCLHTMSRTKSSADSRQQHVYVNTQENDSTQPASSDKLEYEDVEANSEVRATMSEQEVDADTEYTSLGERQSEHNYSDLHKNLHDGQYDVE